MERCSRRLLWKEYAEGKHTYEQLATRHSVSRRTIQRRLDRVKVKDIERPISKVMVVMDTSYFGRGFGVMVFRDAYTKKNIYWIYVKHETLAAYISGIEHLQAKGYYVAGIVCDGKRGLFHAFGNIPVQMCQFHQIAIIRRYITGNPKLASGIELKEVMKLLTQTDKESFTGAVYLWHEKWRNFLREKTYYPFTKRKWRYTHERLRSAYNSLIYNLPYLFTWYDNLPLKMPTTTNSIEGTFSNLKTKLRVHAGLKLNRKIKVINHILAQ